MMTQHRSAITATVLKSESEFAEPFGIEPEVVGGPHASRIEGAIPAGGCEGGGPEEDRRMVPAESIAKAVGHQALSEAVIPHPGRYLMSGNPTTRPSEGLKEGLCWRKR
jgi:hypothetical protein